MLIVFDAYGTLFDWNGGIAQALALEGVSREDGCLLAANARDVQLRLAWHAALTEAYRDFDRLTREAFTHVLGERMGPEAVERVAQAQDALPLFPDVTEALDGLRDVPLAILSNGTLRALQAMLSRHGLLFSFHHIVSTDPARTYKPARRAYQHAVQTLNVQKRDVLFVSSNDWDAAAAAHFGFRVCYLARSGARPLPYGRAPQHVLRSMAELPPLLASLRTS
ncbi:haloacid dehalogenase type II [Alicyclobacillus vulcanalis]|uniref:2-haloacid dehalogenase n=1 Tax=Alicyclobacillus vulcanalis TaxID=252246 RepID=A0A1N7KXG6_9BACL|nr:haloacid dehalogenase type II [Alicyclobacillus vulcanalis]SIS66100.1 2-haloacid dehalogenase [Alicyclobacillus vulcanalis]